MGCLQTGQRWVVVTLVGPCLPYKERRFQSEAYGETTKKVLENEVSDVHLVPHHWVLELNTMVWDKK